MSPARTAARVLRCSARRALLATACCTLVAVTSSRIAAQIASVAPVFDDPARLFTGAAVVDSEARDTGVALGGLGAGRFDLCTDGSFRHVTIGPLAVAVPRLAGTFFELSVTPEGAAGGAELRRALVLGGAGGLPGVSSLRYRGIFPRAFVSASDPALPVRVDLEAWAPFVPHDVGASSLPAAEFDVALTNTSSGAVTASLTLHWPVDPALPTRVALQAEAGPGGEVEHSDGRVTVSFALAAGASGRATIVVGWDAPTQRAGARLAAATGADGAAAASGAQAAAAELLARRDELHAATRAWQALLFESDLPEWYAERLCNDLEPLVTNTRLLAGGPFAMAESGAGLGGILGTMDQRLIAHVATQAFFPELDREELLHFAERQRPDGEIAHHLGSLDGTVAEDAGFLVWPDLAASFVLQCWQHERWTGEPEFAAATAGPMSAALRWLIARDGDGDGIPDGGSTFDYRAHQKGFVYSASLALAAFEAGRRFAEERGDGELAAACAAAAERARAALVGTLWNGRWFARALGGGEATSDCFLGQLAGEWYAGTMGWPSLVPAALRDRALASMVALNGAASPYAPPLDVGADGSSPARAHWGWLPHVAAFYAAPLIAAGRTDDALACLQAADRMLVTTMADPWNVGLYFNPATGRNPKPDYGWYMSTPATWWTLAALSGTTLDVPAAELRLSPQPPAARRGFTLPVFTPSLTARLAVDDLEFGVERTLRLDVLAVHDDAGGATAGAHGGALRIARLVIAPPAAGDAGALVMTATLDGVALSGIASRRGDDLVLELAQPAELSAGSSLVVVIGEPVSAAVGHEVAAQRASARAVLENERMSVELEHDGNGLRRLVIGDRVRGGEARFDVADLFRIVLPASGGAGPVALLADPALARWVRVDSVTHEVGADARSWTLREELVVNRPGQPADQPLSVEVEARLGAASVRLELRVRGAALTTVNGPPEDGPPVQVGFPRLELLDPGRVGEPLVLRAGGSTFADAARSANWAGAWSSATETEAVTISGPVPTLVLRWVGGTGEGHTLTARGDGARSLRLESTARLEGADADGWRDLGGALEIALP